jgi:hypothetical protein
MVALFCHQILFHFVSSHFFKSLFFNELTQNLVSRVSFVAHSRETKQPSLPLAEERVIQRSADRVSPGTCS